MAKKRNRRSQKSTTPVRRADLSAETLDEVAVRPGKTAAQTPVAQSRQEAAVAQLEQEYGYVGKDLRRVFILAGAMFALLIVLNLLLSR